MRVTLRKWILAMLMLVFVMVLAPSPAEAATKPPKTPKNLKVWMDDNYTVYFTWSSVKCDFYRVEVACSESGNLVATPSEPKVKGTFIPGEHVKVSLYSVRDGEEYYYVYSEKPCEIEFDVEYKAPTGLKVDYTKFDQISLSWKNNILADGYTIYRSSSKDGWFDAIGTVDKGVTSFVDEWVSPNCTYYYKVAANYNQGALVSEPGKTVTATSTADIPKVSAAAASYKSVKLTWTAKDVEGYKIYRSDSKDGEYKLIKNIKNPETMEYVNKKLTMGKTYYYKMRSYSKLDGQTYHSDYTAPISVVPAVVKAKIVSAKITDRIKVKLTWEKVAGAHGYTIYRSTQKDKGYKAVKTINDSTATSCVISGQKNGNLYYFKVKAFRTSGDQKVYGVASSPKSRFMNRLAFNGETYAEKAQRIWGTDYYKDYTSSSEASKDMKSIKIKVWDIGDSGKKYTRTFTLTVHKNIAETVAQIFQEIYEGPEKFPIHSVGGYSWRGDNSNSEHCEGLAIDINPDENPMMYLDTGEILAGKEYNPGKNPYSIPADGDVVKTFRKYGFSWGQWGNKVDYMHFSYFGT